MKLVATSAPPPTPSSPPASQGWFWPIVLTVAAVFMALGLWLSQNLGSTQTPAATQTVQRDAVQQVLALGKPTVVEFGANSCASCREMKPVLHALSQDLRLIVADVDILKERDYISRYQIRLMPTQVFYNAKGEETGRHMGKISGDEILERLGIAGSTGSTLPKATL